MPPSPPTNGVPPSSPSPGLHDRFAIRELIENWVVWRDSGDWDKFATLWHDDAIMVSTWRQSTAAEFIRGCKDAWADGLQISHSLGGGALEVAGDRAIAQTKMTIAQRAAVHGVLVDVECHGRFYDLLEKRAGSWGIVLRQPIYERDRMDPVTPGSAPVLDPALLQRFPAGYRHLAYLQTCLGMTVKADMPGLRGPEVEALYGRGARWLEGRALDLGAS